MTIHGPVNMSVMYMINARRLYNKALVVNHAAAHFTSERPLNWMPTAGFHAHLLRKTTRQMLSRFLRTCCTLLARSCRAVCAIHCVSKKVPTFKLSVTLSNLNRFSKLLHCRKAHENCYKVYTTLPTSP